MIITDFDACSEESDESLACTETAVYFETVGVEAWTYDRGWNGILDYTFNLNDKEIMNFASYEYDYWDTDNYFTVHSNQTFTMPNHDVLFSISTSPNSSLPSI